MFNDKLMKLGYTKDTVSIPGYLRVIFIFMNCYIVTYLYHIHCSQSALKAPCEHTRLTGLWPLHVTFPSLGSFKRTHCIKEWTELVLLTAAILFHKAQVPPSRGGWDESFWSISLINNAVWLKPAIA